MVVKGYDRNKAIAIIDPYNEIASFTYMSVYNPAGMQPKLNCDFVQAFGSAYLDYGLYIFYKDDEIIYVGESAEEPFNGRLSQHFNESDGGLRDELHNYPALLTDLETSSVLILYGKYTKEESRETHFDEDLLIGLFRPELNKR